MSEPDLIPDALQKYFGFSEFRPHQEEVCQAAIDGHDLLLVMPTGAGKSLCYQLPALVRGGTAIVISPLIALMEDQVAKLRALKLRAEALHSGRDRLTARQICRDYLLGNLQFLFIAPERLSVPGFPEMLTKRRPTLIAVDEAHCISQWGHDFRPDYRMLKVRLPLLRPAPIVALTATATLQVQNDILEQLGLTQAKRFIHGFRRSNLGIEIHALDEERRTEAAASCLRSIGRRPAIVYAPTRKESESIASRLNRFFPTSAYHAGLGAKEREKVQGLFLEGKTEVVVATIAFGMGIDKANVRTVIHTSLPGSVESYYQEIGRAGRDGQPSHAVLMHSKDDQRRHDYFFQRDYPELSALTRYLSKVKKLPDLQPSNDGDFAAFKHLKIHGALQGGVTWQTRYLAQRKHRLHQMSEIARLTEAKGCRMVHLIRYFGDTQDTGRTCGHCDFCAPQRLLLERISAGSKAKKRVTKRRARKRKTSRP